MICEAIIHKPKRIATPMGTLGQILYAINPKSIDYILNTAYHLFPDSSAAKGEKPKEREAAAAPPPATDEQASNQQVAVRVPDARRALVAPEPRPSAGARKHWGWGCEDQQPSPRRRSRRRRPAIRERLGFGGDEIEEPVPLEAIELPRAAARSRRRRWPRSVSADRHERVSHALGKAYRDVVRGFRGEFENPPDLVARPRDEAEVERGARLVRRRGRRGDPLRRRHQRRRRRRAAGRRRLRRRGHDRPRRARPRARGRRGLARGADPGRRPRPGARGPAAPSTASPCATSRSRSSSRRSAAGSRPAPAATSPPSTPTSTTWSSRCARSRRRGEWESRRLPGSGAGPSPDRMLIGSEGILGVITEAWVRRPGAAALQALVRGRLRLASPPAPRRCASSPSRASTRPTAACSTRPRRSSPHAGDARQGAAGARLRVGRTTRSTRSMELALECARDHGGEPGEVRARRRAAGRRSSRRRGTPVGAWRHAFLAAPYLRDTFVAVGVLSDTFETAITWDRFADFHADVIETARRAVAEVSGAPAEGDAAPQVMLPLHPRLPRRAGALLHDPRPGAARLRGRAVGRDQGRGLRRGDRRRRHDHPPPRGRPRPPPLVRPPAPGRASPRRCARPSAQLDPRGDPQPGRPDRPVAPRRPECHPSPRADALPPTLRAMPRSSPCARRSGSRTCSSSPGLLFSGQFDEGAQVLAATLTFVAFCAISSAGYLLNDLRDREHDRPPPREAPPADRQRRGRARRPPARSRRSCSPRSAIALGVRGRARGRRPRRRLRR